MNQYGADYAKSLIVSVYFFNKSKSNLEKARKILNLFKDDSRAQCLLKGIK